jgi:hypothetical protein
VVVSAVRPLGTLLFLLRIFAINVSKCFSQSRWSPSLFATAVVFWDVLVSIYLGTGIAFIGVAFVVLWVVLVILSVNIFKLRPFWLLFMMF